MVGFQLSDISNGGVKYGITSVNLQVSSGAFKPPQAHTGWYISTALSYTSLYHSTESNDVM